MPYLYEGHTGSIYCTEYEEDDDTLYCEMCGDSDVLVGFYDSLRDLLFSYAQNIDIEDGDGGLDLNWFLRKVSVYFEDAVTPEQARGIVKRAKSGYSNIR